MNLKKTLIIVSLIICILFSISGVSANDLNDTVTTENQEVIDEVISASAEKGLSGTDDKTFSISENDDDILASENELNSVSDGNSLSEPKFWYVDISSTSSIEDGSQENPYKTFKLAYNSANDGDTIYIAPGIYTGEDNMYFDLDKKLLIAGTGDNVIFDGEGGICVTDRYGREGNPRLFTVWSDLAFYGITFRNAKTDADGAALWVAGDNCIVYNCKFINNVADGKGGAIHVYRYASNFYGNNFSVINCEFNNNYGRTGGGAIYWIGNYGFVAGSQFKGNSIGYTGVGGAIAWVGHAGEIYNCSFDKNYVRESWGGASRPYSVTIFADGGAVYWIGNIGLILQSTFENNYLENYGRGGSVCWDGEYGMIYDCYFNNNSNMHGLGGAIYWHGNNGNVSKSTFKNNIDDASYGGGAITWNGNDGCICYCKSYLNDSSGKNDIYLTGENIEIIDYPIIMDATDISKYYGGLNSFKITLTKESIPISGVYVKITVNGKTYSVKTNSKGQAAINLDLPVGTYNIVSKYDDVSVTSKCTVKSTVTTTDSKGTYLNSKVSTTFLNTNGKVLTNTKVTFKVDGKTYTATTNSNGVATANIPLAVGTYTVTAVNPVNNEQKQFKLTISKASPIITLTASQNADKVTLTANINPNSATGEVSFYIVPIIKYDDGSILFLINESKVYDGIKISNGKAVLTISDLSAGDYSYAVYYGGDSNVQPYDTDSVDFNVAKVYAILTAADVTKTQEGSEKLTINLADNYGNAIANTNVNVRLNGVTTTLKTDSNGKASMPIGLTSGTYLADITFNGANKYDAVSVTANIVVKKSAPILSAKSVTLNYGDKKYLVVSLKYLDGTPVSDKEINAKIAWSHYFYLLNKKTDSNGQIKIDYDLAPNNYKVYLSSKGCKDISTKIVVKKATPKLTAKAQTFKKSVKTKKYTITLKTNKNKVMKKVKVTLKVNGKTYSAKTNSKGQATFKITKLTKKGKFTAVVKYSGNKYYNAKTVKPKITVK